MTIINTLTCKHFFYSLQAKFKKIISYALIFTQLYSPAAYGGGIYFEVGLKEEEKSKKLVRHLDLNIWEEDRYTLQLMGDSPTPNSLDHLKAEELGLFCEGDRLYCKIHGKDKMQIMRSDDPVVPGCTADSFDRMMGALKAVLGPQEYIQQEQVNGTDIHPVVSITALDKTALIKCTEACGYLKDKHTIFNHFVEFNIFKTNTTANTTCEIPRIRPQLLHPEYRLDRYFEHSGADLLINHYDTTIQEEISFTVAHDGRIDIKNLLSPKRHVFIKTFGNVYINCKKMDVEDGKTIENMVPLDAQRLYLSGYNIYTHSPLHVEEKLKLTAAHNLINNSSLWSDGKLRIDAAAKVVNHRHIEGRSGETRITTHEFLNHGLVNAHQSFLALNVHTGENHNIIFGQTGIDLTVHNLFTNHKVVEETEKGLIESWGSLEVKGTGTLKNYGFLKSVSETNIQTHFENSGRVKATTDLVSETEGKTFINGFGGQLRAKQEIKLKNTGRVVQGGRIKAPRATLTIEDLQNFGQIRIHNDLMLTVNRGRNGGTVESKNCVFTILDLFRNRGNFTTTRSFNSEGEGTLLNQCELLSKGCLTFNNKILNNESHVNAIGPICFSGDVAVENGFAAKILSDTHIEVAEKAAVSNLGILYSEGTFRFCPFEYINKGRTEAKGNMDFPHCRRLENIAGCHFRSETGTISLPLVTAFLNRGSVLSHGTLIFEKLLSFHNDGALQSRNKFIMSSPNPLINEGYVSGDLGAIIDSAQGFENKDTVVSKETVNITAPQIKNDKKIHGQKGVTLTASQTLINEPIAEVNSAEGKIMLASPQHFIKGSIKGQNVDVQSQTPFEGPVEAIDTLTLHVPKGWDLKGQARQFGHSVILNGPLLNPHHLDIKGGFTWNNPGSLSNDFNLIIGGKLTLNIEGNWENLARTIAHQGADIRAHNFDNKGFFYGNLQTLFHCPHGFENHNQIVLVGKGILNTGNAFANHPTAHFQQFGYHDQLTINAGTISNKGASISIEGILQANASSAFVNHVGDDAPLFEGTTYFGEKYGFRARTRENPGLPAYFHARGLLICSPILLNFAANLSASQLFQFRGNLLDNRTRDYMERGTEISTKRKHSKRFCKIKYKKGKTQVTETAYRRPWCQRVAILNSHGTMQLSVGPINTGSIQSNIALISAPSLTNFNASSANQKTIPIPPTIDLADYFDETTLDSNGLWKLDRERLTSFQAITSVPLPFPSQEDIDAQSPEDALTQKAAEEQALAFFKTWLTQQFEAEWNAKYGGKLLTPQFLQKKAIALEKLLARAAGIPILWEPNLKNFTKMTPNYLSNMSACIAVVADARLRGGERMRFDPHLLAHLVTKAFMSTIGFASISKRIHSSTLLSRILEEQGYLNARKAHGLPPQPAPANWTRLSPAAQLAAQLREIILPTEIDKFRDPAIVYRPEERFGELVLSPIATLPTVFQNSLSPVLGAFTSRYLNITTTSGDLNVANPVAIDGVDLKSAANLSTRNIHTGGDVNLEAAGAYSNYENVKSQLGDIATTAASITNHEKGVMEGDMVSLEATQGNIDNYGTLHGRTYLDKEAAADITDNATLHWRREGKVDVPYYTPAQSIGGTGIHYQDDSGQTRKLGLKEVAKGKIINNASYKIAEGDIYQEGRLGILHQAQITPYIAARIKHHTGFLKHKERIEEIRSAVTATANLISTRGRIISHVPEGGLTYTGANAVGADGDIAIVRDQIRYGYLLAPTGRYVHKSSGWGVKKSSRRETHQHPIITKFINGSTIDHTSLLKGIHGSGVSIRARRYNATAKEEIVFDDVQATHTIRHKQTSVVPTFFGSGMLQGQSFGTAIVNSDPLGTLIDGFSDVRGDSNKLAQAVLIGVQVWQDAATLSEAYNQGNLADAFLERYGNVGLSFSHSNATHTFTTSTPPTFDVNVLTATSAQSVGFLGGTQADIKDLFEVDSPAITFGKATNTSSTSSHCSSVGVGVNVLTGLPYINGATHSSHAHSTTYQNARFDIYGSDGVANLGDPEILNFDGGTLSAAHIKGNPRNLQMTTYQDKYSRRNYGGSISLSGSAAQGMTGSVSASKGRAHQRKVNEHSSLTATQGFGKDFTIDHLTVTDTVLDPTLVAQANTVTFNELKDEASSRHHSISLANLNLNSPTGFVKSVGKSAATMGVAYGATKIARAMGADDLQTSAVGTVAGIVTSAAINKTMEALETTTTTTTTTTTPAEEPEAYGFGPLDYNPTQPGLNVIGEFSEEHNGRHTRVIAVDADLGQMGRDIQGMRRAAEKLESALSQLRIVAPEEVQSQIDVLEKANQMMDKAGIKEQEKSKILEEISPILIDAAIEDEKARGKPVAKKLKVKTEDKKAVVEIATPIEIPSLFEVAYLSQLEPKEKEQLISLHLEPEKTLKKAQQCLDVLQRNLALRKGSSPSDHQDLGSALRGCLQEASIGLSSEAFKDRLAYYPLNNTQEEAVGKVFHLYTHLENGENISQQFSDQYQSLGYNPLYCNLLRDDTMRLHLLSRIDATSSTGTRYEVVLSGEMPDVPARDLGILGLLPRLIGGTEAAGRGPVGYVDGQDIYIHPTAHEYITGEALARELAALGLTKGAGTTGKGARMIGRTPAAPEVPVGTQVKSSSTMTPKLQAQTPTVPPQRSQTTSFSQELQTFRLRDAEIHQQTGIPVVRGVDGKTITPVSQSFAEKIGVRPVRSLENKTMGSHVTTTTTVPQNLSVQGAREQIGFRPESAWQAQLLKNRLIAEEISAGHALEKHIVSQGEFPGWLRTKEQLKNHIENVLNDQTTQVISIGNGRTAFIHRPSHSVVIRNPNARDGGTVFQPSTDMDHFLNQRGWQ